MEATLRKDPAAIQRMFGRIAPTYDFLNHLLSFGIDRRWRAKAVALARPRGPVLDVCTGTGDLAAAFLRSGAGPVTGVDFCAPMLLAAAGKPACRGARLLRGDAVRLPFPTGQFDVVSAAFGIRNVSDLDRGLSELVRVARPGGRIAVLEFTTPKNRLFRGLYLLYFGRILPFIGNLVSRSRAYSYLNRSVLAWTSEEDLAGRLRRAGCASVAVHPLTFGIAAVHLGVKG